MSAGEFLACVVYAAACRAFYAWRIGPGPVYALREQLVREGVIQGFPDEHHG